jgi:4,5-dihydroxyphthalate decarboxylase
VTTPLKLTMTCGPYDRAQSLIDGSVKPKGIDLMVTVNGDDADRQGRALRGEYDACEFYTGTYIADLPFRKLGFTAIPIFVKRMFRHSYIYVNKKSGIRKASDLNGRRVGIQFWATTAAVWAKGILEEDYGVDLSSIQWIARNNVSIPDWKPPSWLKIDISSKSQFDLLASGETAAAITTEVWAPDVHPDIGFLFPDYPQQEREFFLRTKCFPIMHTLLIKNGVLERHPWVARSLFDAWEESKQRLYKHQEEWQRIHMTSLGYRALWEQERAIGGGDFYQWGFRKTRHELDKLLTYAHKQGITPRRFQPEDMFFPAMLET